MSYSFLFVMSKIPYRHKVNSLVTRFGNSCLFVNNIVHTLFYLFLHDLYEQHETRQNPTSLMNFTPIFQLYFIS